MLRVPRSWRILSLIISFLLMPQISWSDQVDTASVAKILDGDSLPHPIEMNDKNSDKLLDNMANSETRLLDQGNKDWNVSSPKWRPVYDRIHADFESEKPAIMATLKDSAPKMEHDYVADIASHLSQSDVDAILAYYSTPEGQRYQDFMRRIDKVMSSGVASLVSKDPQSIATKPTPEQMKQYMRMLELSRLFQSTIALLPIAKAAHQDTSDYGAISFMAGMAVTKNQTELETLDKEYANDISGFEAFSKTDAAQHFSAAMGQAMPHAAKNNPLADSIRAVEQKHASEWKALYLAQTAP